MRFQQYILNEGRSKNISKEKAVEILSKNCMEALNKWKNGKKIFR